MPRDYGDAFRVLAEVEVLDDGLAGRMVALAGARNLIVHLYAEVDDERLARAVREGGLDDLSAFARGSRRSSSREQRSRADEVLRVAARVYLDRNGSAPAADDDEDWSAGRASGPRAVRRDFRPGTEGREPLSAGAGCR